MPGFVILSLPGRQEEDHQLHTRSSPMTVSETQAGSWYGRIAARVAAHWTLKATGTAAFMAVFFVGYLHLLRNPLFPVTIMPVTALDRSIAFQPAALGFYLSLWFYVSLPPALLDTRPELYSFGWHVGGLCLAGMLCFLFWPTAVPPAAIDWQQYSGFAVLKGVDAGGNACPSMHVATAVFSGIWLDRLLAETAAPRGWRAGNWVWCLGIVYSTLAIRQHVAIDVAAGTLLGAGVAALSLAMRPQAEQKASMRAN